MDTVLGLSVTPTAVGWILAEGHGADGAILDHHELQLQDSPQDGRQRGQGVRAVNTAEQVAAEVLRARDVAIADNHRLRVVGVTWSDEASAQAALLLEALTDAGLDNVVPVRLLDAVETLAQAIAPVIGYEQTAVCILEREWATVVMVDTHDGETQTAVKHVRGGFDGLTSWLTGMFDRSPWRPGGRGRRRFRGRCQRLLLATRESPAGSGVRPNHGAGDYRAWRGAGSGAKHRIHRRRPGSRIH